MSNLEAGTLSSSSSSPSSTAFSRASSSFVLFLACLVVLLLSHLLTTRVVNDTSTCSSETWHQIIAESGSNPWLTIVILSAPRPDNEPHLIVTLQSLLSVWPSPSDHTNPLSSKLRILVFNPFPGRNDVFQAAQHIFSGSEVGTHYISFVEKSVPDRPIQPKDSQKTIMLQRQKAHASAALKEAMSLNSSLVMLLEDDFPLCHGEWDTFLNVLCKAHELYPSNCGADVATGGSGLIFKRDVLSLALTAINESSPSRPHDVLLQDCLLGRNPACAKCQDLAVSARLLFKHIGHKSSTIPSRKYDSNRWQCGWRQPFVEFRGTHAFT